MAEATKGIHPITEWVLETVRALVPNPAAVLVEEREAGRQTRFVLVEVSSSDERNIGYILGRTDDRGIRTIDAIRHLAKKIAARHEASADVEIVTSERRK